MNVKLNILPAPHHSLDHCVESHPATSSDWLNNLHRGCLNKGASDKFRLYSHLRALTAKQVPGPSAQDRVCSESRSNLQIRAQPSRHKSTTGVTVKDESTPKPPKLSPVFLEDSTVPPDLSKDISPQMFAVDEFFKYVWSENWKAEVCLRIVGGQLLKFLLMALCDLEAKQQINSQIIRANLNSRRQFSINKEDVVLSLQQRNPKRSGVPSLLKATMSKTKRKSSKKNRTANKNESADVGTFPSITQQRTVDEDVTVNAGDEWRCESMGVQLIFYEKADASNVLYMTGDNEPSVVKSLPLPRYVLYPAYSQTEHKMNYVRLPISEDVDSAEKIGTLIAEINNVFRSKLSVYSHQAREDSLQSSRTRSRGTPKKSPGERSAKDKEIITDDVWFHSKDISKATSQETGYSGAFEEWVFPSQDDDQNDYYKSYPQSLDDDMEIGIYKQLNLSRQEMYVTGLYAARAENRLPIKVKLQRIKMAKQKLQSVRKAEIVKENAAREIRYQHTPASILKGKLSKRRDYLPPVLKNETKKQDTGINNSGKLWDEYIKTQEKMEMDVALGKNVETKIVERIQSASIGTTANTTPGRGSSKPKITKSKQIRGKKVSDAIPTVSKMGSATNNNLNSNYYQPSPLSFDAALDEEQEEVRKKQKDRHGDKNFNSNSSVLLPRRRIFSKRYLYVHEFQEPVDRLPRPPSGYQIQRSYRIMDHTPYVITGADYSRSRSRSSLIYSNYTGNSPQRVYLGKSRINDDNWSHLGVYPHDYTDQKISFGLGGSDGYQCPCAECQYLRTALADLKPDATFLPSSYHSHQDQLTRDFEFLEGSKSKTLTVKPSVIKSNVVKPNVVTSHFVTIDLPQIRDHVIRLVDKILIRKEIVTSSLGNTHVTVTFSKRRIPMR